MRHTAAVGLTVAALALASTGCDIPGSHTMHNGSTTASGYYSYTATPTTTAAPLPVPQDFTLEVIELSRKCFGTAGCSVEYRIVPTYQRWGVPPGSFSLLYEVDGGDEPQTGNIEVRNGHYSTEEGYLSTSGGTLTARVTQVLED